VLTLERTRRQAQIREALAMRSRFNSRMPNQREEIRGEKQFWEVRPAGFEPATPGSASRCSIP
jgi:hypothetical protein